MLRPATPLSVLLLVAFVLLLLSVLSTPIIQAIPLGSYRDVTFGVLGYCSANGCSKIGLGYGDIEKISPGDSQDFNFSPSVRNTLSTVLVLHPVAALLTLITFIMAMAAHLRSASHSSRYLLFFFVLLIITFLVSIAAFVVDLLLFLPHQAWGSYIVLAAAILVLISGVGSCFMRRHLLRRKSFRAKNDDNTNIGSSDFYGIPPKPSFGTVSQPTVPVLSGANGSPDNLPSFSTYEHDRKDDRMSDEQIPLTLRSTSDRSPPSMDRSYDDMPPPGAVGVALSGPSPQRSRSQDPYLNQTNGNTDPYGVTRASSFEHMNRGGRRNTDSPGNYRGNNNSGYTPPYMRGRGGFGPRGGPTFGPRGRGGYGTPPNRGAYGPGGSTRGGGRAPGPGHMNIPEPFDRRPQPEQQAPYRNQSPLASDPSMGSNRSNGNGRYLPYTPTMNLPRAESPPPLPSDYPQAGSNYPTTQPIEMDATPVEGSNSPVSYGQGGDRNHHYGGLATTRHEDMIPEHPEPAAKPNGADPEDQYVPARAAWNPDQNARGASPHREFTPPILQPGRNPSNASPAQAGEYYEDVDPQFDQAAHNNTPQPQQLENGYDLMRNRSPAESERSNFTSISQRGVNPQWNGHPPMPQPPHGAPPRQPVQQRHDMLLDNPDFKMPGGRTGASGQRGAGGMIPGSAYPQGSL